MLSGREALVYSTSGAISITLLVGLFLGLVNIWEVL